MFVWSERQVTFYRRRLIVLLLVATSAWLIVHSLGPRQGAADGSGINGASTSSAPSSSAPATSPPSRGTGRPTSGQLEYNASLHCEDEGCSMLGQPLPFGAAAGGRVVDGTCSPERTRPGDTCRAAASICPREERLAPTG
jgi:hypothetical protein